MNKDIAKVIADISEVATLINLETEHDVFINISAHVKRIQFLFHEKGWVNSKEPTYFDEMYFDEKNIKRLRGVLDTLRKIYKNGRVNSKNFDYETEEIKHYKFK
ncbi:hypothetical protein GCM10008908_24280 [Clostridium subterminale]|uniref:Uncharacterized protein n=1 Tax=Clostridium subterminale TaxID=1550 RepID=A0ABN1KRV2_CLOSU